MWYQNLKHFASPFVPSKTTLDKLARSPGFVGNDVSIIKYFPCAVFVV
jgi:hypothetical protein